MFTQLLELIVQVNKSYDGPLSATPRALSMPTVLSPPGSPSLMPTSPRGHQQQPVSPRSATGAGTAASNPGLMRSQSTPINDPSVIEEKTIHCRQLLSVVLSKVNSITDINFIVAMGQVGKAIKKVRCILKYAMNIIAGRFYMPTQKFPLSVCTDSHPIRRSSTTLLRNNQSRSCHWRCI